MMLQGFASIKDGPPPHDGGDRLIEFIGTLRGEVTHGMVWFSGWEFYDPDGEGLPDVAWWRELQEGVQNGT